MLAKKFYKAEIETDEEKRQEFVQGQIWADHNGYRMGEFDDYYQIVEKEEEIIEPTQLDIIEAQVMYTALMTDTLIESEVE